MTLNEVEQKYKCKYISAEYVTDGHGNIEWFGNSRFEFEDGDFIVIEQHMRHIPFQQIVEKYLRKNKLKRILNEN